MGIGIKLTLEVSVLASRRKKIDIMPSLFTILKTSTGINMDTV